MVIIVIAIGLVIELQGREAYAVTPPDSCFNFDASTGTIVEYFDYQNNDSLQPSCPKAVDIPSTIAGVDVLHIGYQAFRLGNRITAVTFPSTLESIGEEAFVYNSIAGTVTIPDTVTSIGKRAFLGNYISEIVLSAGLSDVSERAFESNSLTTLTIPANISTIGVSAFAGNRLADLVIPDTVTSIGQSAFQSNRLTSLTLPSSLTDIPSYAFYANSIDTINIPSNIQTIGTSAFANNYTTTLNIANGLTSIGQSAFSRHELTSLYLPDSVSSIGLTAFRYGPLESLRLPSTITEIGVWAFADNHLTSLDLPLTLQTIQHGAFENNRLTYVYFPDSVTRISNAAFKNNQIESMRLSPNLKSDGIGIGAFMRNQLTTVDLPSSITSISDEAFRNNNLTSVALPPDVTIIGIMAFAENNLETVDFTGDKLAHLSSRAFMSNRIVEVDLPSPTSILSTSTFSMQSSYGKSGYAMMSSGDKAQAQALLDDVWYTQLNLRNLTNSHNLVNANMIESYYEYLFHIGDINQDGDEDDSLGGHIINPGSITVRYVDESDNDILPSANLTGSNRYSYRASENVSNDMTPYYKVGGTYSLVAPDVPGYSSPVPASPYVYTLENRLATIKFVYSKKQPVISEAQVLYSPVVTTVDISGQDLDAIETLTVGGEDIPMKPDCSVVTASCYRVESPESIYLALDYSPKEPITLGVETVTGESASTTLAAAPLPDPGDTAAPTPDRDMEGGDGEGLAKTGQALTTYMLMGLVSLVGGFATVRWLWR